MFFVLWLACRAEQTYELEIEPDGVFSVVAPGEAARARLEATSAWSDARDGLALLVAVGDALLWEHYAPGWEAASPHHIFSGTKSFSCALAVVAEEEGYFSPETRAEALYAPWAGDPRGQT